MSKKTVKIGMIGLDTSHVPAFTELLNNKDHPHYVEGGEVVVAFPGGSDDFELSYSRVEGFTNQLRNDFGITIVNSIAEVAEACDAILLESVDGRAHLEQFRQVAPYGKPVFVDKPLTTSHKDALEIARLAKEHNVPIMSCSAVRYSEALTEVLANEEGGGVTGFDCFGPMSIEPQLPGLYWYGIHTVDMLYRVLGQGCVTVTAVTTETHDVITGEWADGRLGVIRGNRTGNWKFGGVLHRENDTVAFDASAHAKPFYASMMTHIIAMFQGEQPNIAFDETIEMMRFIEAANESRETGKPVKL